MCSYTSLDPPLGSADPCDCGHVVGRDLQAGEERVGIRALAVALGRELDPGPDDRIVAVADRRPVHPAEALPLDLLLAVASLNPAAGMDEVVVQQLVYALVGAGLADEQEIRLEVQDQPTQGRAASAWRRCARSPACAVSRSVPAGSPLDPAGVGRTPVSAAGRGCGGRRPPSPRASYGSTACACGPRHGGWSTARSGSGCRPGRRAGSRRDSGTGLGRLARGWR